MKAYKYDDKGNTIETEMPEIEKMTYRIDGLLEAVSEAVAETDEALMEKFFEGEPFTQKELIDGIHNGMNNGIITPVVCTSAVNLSGIDMLLKEIALLIPSADESEPVEAALGDDLIQIKCTTEEPLSAFVFKTVADPFIGKVSYIKVMSGILKADSTVFNSSTGENEKIGKLYFMKGKQQTETSEATAGDIVMRLLLILFVLRNVRFYLKNYLFLFHAIQWQYAAHRVMKAKFQPAFKEYLTKTKP